jgi:hypothetical protein
MSVKPRTCPNRRGSDIYLRYIEGTACSIHLLRDEDDRQKDFRAIVILSTDQITVVSGIVGLLMESSASSTAGPHDPPRRKKASAVGATTYRFPLSAKVSPSDRTLVLSVDLY